MKETTFLCLHVVWEINRGDEKNVMQTSQKATSFCNRFIFKKRNQEKVKKIFNKMWLLFLCNLKHSWYLTFYQHFHIWLNNKRYNLYWKRTQRGLTMATNLRISVHANGMDSRHCINNTGYCAVELFYVNDNSYASKST